MLFILFYIFVVSLFIQLIYYWFVFCKFAFFRAESIEANKYHPVSVVICAKNEYNNLRENLPLILEQDYQDFEVVVVNDCSDDDTDFLLKKLAEKYEHLTIVTIQNNVNFFSGKKFPLSVGIKSAKNEILLLTDADCKPRSSKWIYEMQKRFLSGINIVLGYGAYEIKKGLLNKLIRYDTATIAIQYFSLALRGSPYMGVGRNLAYKKSLFFENKGFTTHYTVSSGDDDLFINQVANRKNTIIEISAASHTISKPKTHLKNWIIQKKRHLSTSKYYKNKHKIILGFFSMSQIVFFTVFFILIIKKIYLLYTLILFTVRLLSQVIVNKYSLKKLDERKILLFSPIFEIIILLINIYISFTNLFSKKTKWK